MWCHVALWEINPASFAITLAHLKNKHCEWNIRLFYNSNKQMKSQRAKHQEKGNGASFLEMLKLVKEPKTIEETQRVQTIRGCKHARKTNTPDSKPNKGTKTKGGQIDEGVCITCPKTERICKGFVRLCEGSGGIPWFCCLSGRGCVLHGVRVCCIFCLLFCFNSVHIRGIVRANGFTRSVCKNRWFI